MSFRTSVNPIRLGGLNKNPSEYKEAEVVIDYPAQFEAIRLLMNFKSEDYIKSLSTCFAFNANGGKSDAAFLKSNDDLLIVKMLSKDEFMMFK